jgi:cobalt-zinc-cadmium efflux system protein
MQTQDNTRLLRAYRIAIALNLGFVILEVVVGRLSHSLGLVSDAGHKLIDVFALIIALVGFSLARRSGSGAGEFRRISAGIALVNALILLVAVVIIIVEAVGKFSEPAAVNGAAISWTAGAGILVSGLSAWLLMHHRGDINTRAAFLHMATDSLLSLGVVLSGIAISLTGAHFIDPVVSLVVAAVILVNTVRLLRDSVRTLRGVPATPGETSRPSR